LELISPESDFHTFGLFTIVEYLLTHPSRNKDKSDSLTNQIRGKCPMVTAKFDYDVPIENFFEAMSEDKAWKTLYGYRSTIAHGGSIDFGKRGYRELKGRSEIEAFLHVFTRLLLKCAVRVPDHIRALKES
jgi:hypothetical protein